jgi:xanthine dehydrogenase accessory factor
LVDCLKKVIDIRESGNPCVLVTVIKKTGDGPCSVGAKMVVTNDYSHFGTVGGGNVEFMAIKHAVTLFEKKCSDLVVFDLKPLPKAPHESTSELKDITSNSMGHVKTGMLCGGEATLFFEFISNRPGIYIFGGGHIGKALSYHLSNLDFQINIIDDRNEYLQPSEGINNILIDYSNIFENFIIPQNSYVLIATHSHEYDYRVLCAILKNNFRPGYIGLVASRKKVSILKYRLKEDFGESINTTNLYMPAGIYTGGNTPAEIAISVISEILTVKHSIEGNKHMSTL